MAQTFRASSLHDERRCGSLRGLSLETLIALQTEKLTILCVSAYVPLEVSFLRKCSRAQVAAEGALARVYAKVSSHVCPFLGHVGAVATIVHSALYRCE